MSGAIVRPIVLDIKHRPIACERLLGTLQHLQFESFDIHFHEIDLSAAMRFVEPRTQARQRNQAATGFDLAPDEY